MPDKQQPIYWILDFVRRYSLAVIIVCALLTAGFALALLRLQVDADLESLLPHQEEDAQIDQNYFVFAAESENPFTLEGLAALDAAIREIENLPGMGSGITPFNLLTFVKEESRLAVRTLSSGGRAPLSDAGLDQFRRRIERTPFAQNLVISRDHSTLVSIFPVQPMDSYTELMNRIDSVLGSLRPYFRTYTTGTIPFMRTAETYLSRDLSRLLALAAAVILVTFYLGFRAKRAVVLPLLIVGTGTIWCFGFMALAGFTVTMISVVIPPLVLALGSSYSIHILNQYFRETDHRTAGNRWITPAIAHVNRTVLLASLTTMAGILSLLAVSMRQTREFAVATGVGIASCALLSLLLFPALLYRLRRPLVTQSLQIARGPLTRATAALGIFAMRARYFVLAAVLVLFGLFLFALGNIRYNTEAMSYFPGNERVVRDMRFFTRKIGGFEEVSLILSAPQNSSNYFLDREVLQRIDAFEHALAQISDISYISSLLGYLKFLNLTMYGDEAIPSSRAPLLLLSRYLRIMGSERQGILPSIAAEDFSSITITVRLYDSARGAFIDEVGLRELLSRIEELQDTLLPGEIVVQRRGPILRYLSLSDILQRDSLTSMLIAAAAILCITSIAFRSLLYGLYALIPLATGITLNVLLMAVVKIPLDMITIMVSSIAIGVGVDDAIHFLIQYRLQRRALPGQIDTALRNTLSAAGRPIVLTTLSIMAGLLILGFAAFKPVRYFGLLVAFTLAAACVGTIMVLPAVLSLGRGASQRGAGS